MIFFDQDNIDRSVLNCNNVFFLFLAILHKKCIKNIHKVAHTMTGPNWEISRFSGLPILTFFFGRGNVRKLSNGKFDFPEKSSSVCMAIEI